MGNMGQRLFWLKDNLKDSDINTCLLKIGDIW